MYLWIIAFTLGLSLPIFLGKILSLWWILVSIPLAVGYGLLIKFKNIEFRKILLGSLIFILGFFWSTIYIHRMMSWSLSKDQEGIKLAITGHVSSIPVLRDSGVDFEFDTDTLGRQQLKVRIKLSYYHGKEINGNNVAIGDKWRLMVKLKRPHGMLNPGGWDFEKQLFLRRIRATGHVIFGEHNYILESSPYSYFIGRLRSLVINRIERIVGDNQKAAIIIALVVGYNGKIDKKSWDVFCETGTGHLVAVSGLHISLVAGFIFLLIKFLWKLSSRLPLLIPAQELATLISFVVGLVYAVISGFAIPTQRALIGLSVFVSAALARRRIPSWSSWFLAIFIVLWSNPLAIMAPGFWLSFMAVAAILYVVSYRIYRKKIGWFANFFRIQLAVSLVLMPFTLLFFQQVSLVSLVSNFVAIPMFGFLIIPIALSGALLIFVGRIGDFLLLISARLLDVSWWWLELLLDRFPCNWNYSLENIWIFIAFLGGTILLLAPRGFPAKYLGMIWMIPLFFYSVPAPLNKGDLWFTLLDAGQGLAAVVRTKNHCLLYDTGPKFYSGTDAGARIVIPYLQHIGVRKLDMVVVSHGDNDHSGGLNSIIQKLPIVDLITSQPDHRFPAFSRKCFSGQHWRWDGVDFSIVSPSIDSEFKGNNSSCVLKISSPKGSILLTGDIEKRVEQWLVRYCGDKLRSTVLIAPHHGSLSSSSRDFIKLVNPEYVLFPVGYGNKFGFPKHEILTRYNSLGAKLFNVAETGAITFKFDDRSTKLIEKYRDMIRKFWHDR